MRHCIPTLILLMPSVILGGTAYAATASANPFNQLPGYQDAKKVNQLLSRGEGTSENNHVPPAIQKELQRLQQTQQALMNQLHSLQVTPVTPPLDQAAASSGVFFSGGAPQALGKSTLSSSENGASSTKTAGLPTISAYQSQNNQSQKVSFLAPPQTGDGTQSPHQMQMLHSPYTVQAGTFLPAVLITATNSDLPGDIVAQVVKNVYDTASGHYLLIPQGTKILGKYNSNISYGQTRVQVKFTRLIRPDGSSIVLSSPTGIDGIGQSGMTGDVDNHWGRILGSAVLSAMFTLPAVVAYNSAYDNDNDNYEGSYGDSAMISAASSASSVGTSIAQKSLNIQPTIKLPVGKMFSVLVNKDMVIPPYKGQGE